MFAPEPRRVLPGSRPVFSFLMSDYIHFHARRILVYGIVFISSGAKVNRFHFFLCLVIKEHCLEFLWP
ncbi:hypothetical protein MT325_m151L [Paramecium bursaria chlorella virus MT325]|uniref:Uncharacterized protein m151L n=1 Tax=Paramecium bursaria Chlorella virus MT325 TaxID=346932 RepID=A7ITN1_PBCVM|nr:hypothetical protein MT325_m151L [Paramecium bursaria chlorella virus MT325]